MQAGLINGGFIGGLAVASGTGLHVCGTGVGFLDFRSKKKDDGLLIDGVVEGFGGCADLEDSTWFVTILVKLFAVWL